MVMGMWRGKSLLNSTQRWSRKVFIGGTINFENNPKVVNG
jgi:hypothetical protein